MGLAEKLGARAARQGRSAPVACGELGTVTVEALPVRELERLLRGADGARAVFYAACRELQSAGEELRKAGKVFTPDGIMQFVSDSEAEAAARTVLELSGQTDENRLPFVQKKTGVSGASDTGLLDESRLASVQITEAASPQEDENRLVSVQYNGVPAPGFGQVSRETGGESAGFDTVPESDKKAQAMGILPSERTQNVVSGEKRRSGGDGPDDTPEAALHEMKSEFGESLHETTSEFRGRSGETVHEITSDFPNSLHEITSELRNGLHEIKSESGEIRRGYPHETTSEFRNRLHETESELAEAVARRLVEGLRRAKWVRGD